ncbi:CLUMA_CG018193, isoform A [Clunio marinus]|uniref:CLUMA_CG018193, isoform A n=1 Tax=Clunio marinus TaxID=568069 RepID=A0A1J1IY12_9DIPT|nr:CLUMA_CG018193, isoform A [Clunio marinus]
MGKKSGIFTEGQHVFAKVKGYSPWPAKITKVIAKNRYRVYFYGTGETASVKSEDLDLYDERNRGRFNTDRQLKKSDYKEAVDQIESAISGNDPAPILPDDKSVINPDFDASNDHTTDNDNSADESQLQIAEDIPKATPQAVKKSTVVTPAPKVVKENPTPEPEVNDEKVSRSGRKIKEKKMNLDEMDPDLMFSPPRKRLKNEDVKQKPVITVADSTSSVEEFRASKKHILTDPIKKSFLENQFEMIHLMQGIKLALGLEQVDANRSIELLDTFKDKILPNITKIMLLKYPNIVVTVKRLRKYIGNTNSWKWDETQVKEFNEKAEKIRTTASAIYESFRILFEDTNESNFWSKFAEEQKIFQEKYNALSSTDLFEGITYEDLTSFLNNDTPTETDNITKTEICEPIESYICGNAYLSKGQLKVHERSHTKEKAFVCGVCGKGFSHRESLVTHSTLHSGIKPYMCECCSAKFSCIGNLIKHRKVRPTSCGLPIYTNRKIFKRAGVKCKGDFPTVIINNDLQTTFSEQQNENVEEIIYDQEYQEASEMIVDPMTDHQYVSIKTSLDMDIIEEKKDLDVFDYIGYEIKNIEEKEREEQQKKDAIDYDIEIESKAEVFPETVEEFVQDFIALNQDSYSDDHLNNEVIEDDAIVIETYEEIFESEQLYDEDSELAEYIEIVNASSFQCKFCPKIYQKKNITIKHLKTEHQIVIQNYNYDNTNRYRKPQKELMFKCFFCPKRYTSMRLMERHQKVHGPEGNLIHKCSCCVKYFETNEERNSHQINEHENRLKCDECNKIFEQPDKLVSHMKYAHLGKKLSVKKYNFVCQLCGRNFNTKVALSDHERSNCGKAPLYQCSHCNKNYHSAGSLKCHITVHTNELDFECSYCSKKFRTKGQLTVHLRSHTKEKNFKCLHCPAEFSHRESLLTHNTIHTGIKRFECSSCGSRFSCISNLLAHRKRHRNTCGDSQVNKVIDADRSVKIYKNDTSPEESDMNFV